jgi:hypothetical protein
LPASRCCLSAFPTKTRIAKAHAVAAKRKGSFEGFEVWDRARFVFRGALSNTRPNGGWPHPATGPPSGGD